MTELHTNGIYGNYEGYLAQLFNPAVGGQFSGGIGTGYGGLGAGAVPNAAFAQQNTLWPQQQVPHQVQMAIQAAQQIAAKQAVHAIQCAQALQQIVQHLAVQQYAQQAMGWQQPQFGLGQPQFGQGMGAAFGAGQVGQAIPQSYGWGAQNPISQALQQQAPQLAPYLATQQQPWQFRHGWVN